MGGVRDTLHAVLILWFDLKLGALSRYPIGQATWTPEGNMGGIVQTIARFVADAKAEGIDLRTKDSILLEEARVGGWEV